MGACCIGQWMVRVTIEILQVDGWIVCRQPKARTVYFLGSALATDSESRH